EGTDYDTRCDVADDQRLAQELCDRCPAGRRQEEEAEVEEEAGLVHASAGSLHVTAGAVRLRRDAAVRWNGLDQPDVAPDDGVRADDGVALEDGGTRIDGHVVLDRGVALGAAHQRRIALQAERAEGHALIDLDVIADAGGLTDDDAGAVVDEEGLADGRAGVDVDARYRVRVLGHDPRQHRDALTL